MGTAMHKTGIFAKTSCVHRQNFRSAFQLRRPSLDVVRLYRVLSTRELHTLLNFSERCRREEALAQFKTLQPSDCRTVGLGLAQFGHHVCVDQVADQSNTAGLRDLTVPRLRSGISNRGPSLRSTSFQVKRFSSFSLCHSSMETTTAVSIPRRVTTCGPFSSVSSISSLKRAFASCNCHLVIHHSWNAILCLVRWLVKAGLWLTVPEKFKISTVLRALLSGSCLVKCQRTAATQEGELKTG